MYTVKSRETVVKNLGETNMNNNKQSHVCLRDYEGHEGKLDYTVTAFDLMLDMKALMREYYVATFTQDAKSLQIQFNNGQKFSVKVEEIK